MEAIWLIPMHVRPVISNDAILQGNIKDPASGLDRFNLTDVGECFYRNFKKSGADIKLKGVEPPFPWEMVFKIDGVPKASLRGLKIGPSTYRSIFKLVHFNEETINDVIRKCLEDLGRDPLDSPYWDDANWQVFQKLLKLSRDSIISQNSSFSP